MTENPQDQTQGITENHMNNKAKNNQSLRRITTGADVWIIGSNSAIGTHKVPLEQLKKILVEFKIPIKVAMDEPHIGRPIP